MTEKGAIKRGRTQVGEVRRPLAAVSSLTKCNQIAFFCDGEDWLIDRKDPIANQIIKLVQQVQAKEKIYEHRGTYRMRAWMIPGDEVPDEDACHAEGARPFGRQGA